MFASHTHLTLISSTFRVQYTYGTRHVLSCSLVSLRATLVSGRHVMQFSSHSLSTRIDSCCACAPHHTVPAINPTPKIYPGH